MADKRFFANSGPFSLGVIAERACAEAYLNDPVPRFMQRPECEALLQRILPRPVATT